MTVTAPPRPPRPGDPVDRDELEALVQALIEEARRRARRRRRIYAGVGLLLGLAGLAAFTILDHTAPSRTASPALASGSGSTLASAKPRLAFASSSVGERRGAIFVSNADGSDRHRVTHYGGWGSDLVWSPDGNELAFTRGYPWIEKADIFVVRADGRRERRLRIPGHEGGLMWSPDGRRIAFTRWYGQKNLESDLRVINPDGRSLRLVSRDAVGISWSPDGRKLMFIGRGPGRPNVYVINVDGSGRQRLSRIAGDEDSFSWSPDGRKIAFVKHPECLRCSALETAGMGNPNTELWVMRADGTGKRRLASGHGMGIPVWSPGGEMLAYQSFYRPRPNTPELRFLKVNELFVVRADGSGKRRLTNGGGPLWSPDGKQIAFVRWPGGAADLYVMNSDGSGQRRLTNTPGYGEVTYAWSNAGRSKP